MRSTTKRKTLLISLLVTFLVLSGCVGSFLAGNPAYRVTIPTTPRLDPGPREVFCLDGHTPCVEMSVRDWRAVLIWIMELKRELTAACIATGRSEVACHAGRLSQNHYEKFIVRQVAKAIAGFERSTYKNNPGALEFHGQAGATRHSGGRFAEFETPEQGKRALEHQVERIFGLRESSAGYFPQMTFRQAIALYANLGEKSRDPDKDAKLTNYSTAVAQAAQREPDSTLESALGFGAVRFLAYSEEGAHVRNILLYEFVDVAEWRPNSCAIQSGNYDHGRMSGSTGGVSRGDRANGRSVGGRGGHHKRLFHYQSNAQC